MKVHLLESKLPFKSEIMCECNVKMLRAVGVAGVSGQNALDVARVWPLRRWCAKPWLPKKARCPKN